MSEHDSPESATPVDSHRANRELERWLFNGGDQREMSETMSGRGLPAGWKDRATIAFIINSVITRDENGKIVNIDVTYDRPEEAIEMPNDESIE